MSVLYKAPYLITLNCHSSLGKRRKEDYAGDTTFFHQLQRGYWQDLLEERKKELDAKKKFKGTFHMMSSLLFVGDNYMM